MNISGLSLARSPKTVISREYSSEWTPGEEPYYPVNDEKNGKMYEEYKRLSENEKKVILVEDWENISIMIWIR